MDLMKRVREEFPDSVIFATTGVTKDTVEEVFQIADGAFVGSYFKKDGVFENPIDEERVKAFMEKVHELNK